MAVNLNAPFVLLQKFAPTMARHKWGRVVNIVSGSVEFNLPGQVDYMASKMGQEGLTRAFATELAEDGIRINAVQSAPHCADRPV